MADVSTKPRLGSLVAEIITAQQESYAADVAVSDAKKAAKAAKERYEKAHHSLMSACVMADLPALVHAHGEMWLVHAKDLGLGGIQVSRVREEQDEEVG